MVTLNDSFKTKDEAVFTIGDEIGDRLKEVLNKYNLSNGSNEMVSMLLPELEAKINAEWWEPCEVVEL